MTNWELSTKPVRRGTSFTTTDNIHPGRYQSWSKEIKFASKPRKTARGGSQQSGLEQQRYLDVMTYKQKLISYEGTENTFYTSQVLGSTDKLTEKCPRSPHFESLCDTIKESSCDAETPIDTIPTQPVQNRANTKRSEGIQKSSG